MKLNEMKEQVGIEIEEAIENLGMRGKLEPNYGWWGRKPSSRSRFSYLLWWAVKIQDESILLDKLKGHYSSILFTPYRIDRKIMEKISDSINENRVELKVHYDYSYWGKDEQYSAYNFDVSTGNIHTPFSEIEWEREYDQGKTGLISQLILVGDKKAGNDHSGPRFNDTDEKVMKEMEKESLIFFSGNYINPGIKIIDPIVCHYPMIFSEERRILSIKELLSGLLMRICNKDSITTL